MPLESEDEYVPWCKNCNKVVAAPDDAVNEDYCPDCGKRIRAKLPAVRGECPDCKRTYIRYQLFNDTSKTAAPFDDEAMLVIHEFREGIVTDFCILTEDFDEIGLKDEVTLSSN